MNLLRHLLVLLRELWAFARSHKKWWLPPVVIVLLLLAAFLVAVSGISPFIYSLF